MSVYECWNKSVFSLRQNAKADVMSSGRLFHSFGPAKANDRSPTMTRRDGRTVSWLEVVDRCPLWDDKRVSWSDRYQGNACIQMTRVQTSIGHTTHPHLTGNFLIKSYAYDLMQNGEHSCFTHILICSMTSATPPQAERREPPQYTHRPNL